jgi:hypothetical protein
VNAGWPEPERAITDDPRAAYSYRHPESGEWAHPRHCGPLEDAHRNYVDPAWEVLEASLHAHPAGPPGSGRPWRALIIGFGRGFEAVALLRRHAASCPAARIDIHGLEPQPQILEPWPVRWHELAAHEAPWWGSRPPATWTMSAGVCTLTLASCRAQDWLLRAPAGSLDLILLDLFSPGKAAFDWQPPIFPLLAPVAARGAVLTTYSCARSLRAGLAEAGAQVEILRRPGFRDSLRAVWPGCAPA